MGLDLDVIFSKDHTVDFESYTMFLKMYCTAEANVAETKTPPSSPSTQNEPNVACLLSALNFTGQFFDIKCLLEFR